MPASVAGNFSAYLHGRRDGPRYKNRELPAYMDAAFSPGVEAASMAWEKGDTNRAELERALAAEKRPWARQMLQQEHADLFGAAPDDTAVAEMQKAPLPAPQSNGGITALLQRFLNQPTGRLVPMSSGGLPLGR